MHCWEKGGVGVGKLSTDGAVCGVILSRDFCWCFKSGPWRTKHTGILSGAMEPTAVVNSKQ